MPPVHPEDVGLPHTSTMPNVARQRPRATGVRHETERSSRGSLHALCWAMAVSSQLLFRKVNAHAKRPPNSPNSIQAPKIIGIAKKYARCGPPAKAAARESNGQCSKARRPSLSMTPGTNMQRPIEAPTAVPEKERVSGVRARSQVAERETQQTGRQKGEPQICFQIGTDLWTHSQASRPAQGISHNVCSSPSHHKSTGQVRQTRGVPSRTTCRGVQFQRTRPAIWIACSCGRRTNQLTDGGPSVTPELPSGVAGPPFGEAPGSAFDLPLVRRMWSVARVNDTNV